MSCWIQLSMGSTMRLRLDEWLWLLLFALLDRPVSDLRSARYIYTHITHQTLSNQTSNSACVLKLIFDLKQILSFLEGAESSIVDPKTEASTSEYDCVDDETYPMSNLSSHLGLALLDVDDVESITSTEYSNLSSIGEYLRDRWSRSSSFD